MADTTKQSEQIMTSARQSLATQRAGGTHRSARRIGGSIGQGSAQEKARVWLNRAKYFAGAVLTILVTAGIAGVVLNGIGFTGIMMVALAVMAAAFVFGNYPKVKTPKREDLTQGSPQDMVANTELWLEQQRKALPPPAVKVVDDQIGRAHV